METQSTIILALWVFVVVSYFRHDSNLKFNFLNVSWKVERSSSCSVTV